MTTERIQLAENSDAIVLHRSERGLVIHLCNAGGEPTNPVEVTAGEWAAFKHAGDCALGVVMEIGALPGTVSFCSAHQRPDPRCRLCTIDKVTGKGRPVEMPLLDRIEEAAGKARREADARLGLDSRAMYSDGTAHGLRAALAMVREAGPTVPRAAVEALRRSLTPSSDMPVFSERGEAYREAMRVAVREIDALLNSTTPPAKDPAHADD